MPSPIVEQLAEDVVEALEQVTTANGYSGTLTVIRSTTTNEEVTPEDLKTVVWMPDPMPSPRPAPWGQIGWVQPFEIAVYIREDESSDTPIDQRINDARSDIEQALMADPRRNGICIVDNRFVQPKILADPAQGFSSLRVFLVCEYRVLRSDPRKLAPSATNEEFFQGGAVLVLAKYASDGRTLGAWQRFADLKITPHLQPIVDSVKGDRDGSLSDEAEVFVGYGETFTVEGENFSPQFLSFQFGASAIATYNQASTALVNVAHTVRSVDSVLPLFDLSSNRIFDVASIQSVTNSDSSITYTAGTDYTTTVDSLKEGLLLLPPASTITPNSQVLVSFTPNAATSRPYLSPQSAPKQEYAASIYWKSTDGTMLVRDGLKVSIKHESTVIDQEQLSTGKYVMRVLDNGTNSASGRIVQPTGALAAAGY